MHFDRINEGYTIVKSNWRFDKVTKTGLDLFGNWSVPKNLHGANFSCQHNAFFGGGGGWGR